jgi:SWI/SNF-related matrix-associated actin-dependent regulator 1 of chromatin subfamily A
MLKLIETSPPKWRILLSDLNKLGVRAPQGFTLWIDFKKGGGSYYWTTDPLAARIFYETYKIGCELTERLFSTKDDYLYNLSYALDTDRQFACPEGLNYFPHQRVGIEYISATPHTLLADEMRSGKSIQSLGYINNSSCKKILITCPKTVKLGWYAEARKWLLGDWRIQVVTSKSEIEPADIYIINYDILHTKIELLEDEYDLVIGDEVHQAKNPGAIRSKFFYGLRAKKKLALSGTPLLNAPEDFLTVLQWLDPMWNRFKVKDDKFLAKSGLVLTMEQVRKLARSSCMIRRTGALDNEPIERRIVPLLVDDDVRPLIKAQLNDITEYAKVSKALGLAKVRLALNHIDIYTTEGEKIVVFAYHKEVIDRLTTSLGAKAVKIYGDTSEKDRQLAIHRFNNDSECQVLVGSIPTMAMGINLSVASHIVFVEFVWTPGMMEQAEFRCTDKDQDKSVLIEYLAYEGSLDYYKLSKIEGKALIADAATN